MIEDKICVSCNLTKDISFFSNTKSGNNIYKRNKCKCCVKNEQKIKFNNLSNEDKEKILIIKRNKHNDWISKNKTNTKFLKAKADSDKKYSNSKKGKEIKDKAKKKWYNNNKEKAILIMRKCREKVTDGYAVASIVKRNRIKKELVYQNKELIEVQRLIIKTNRLWKTSQN